MMLGTTSYRTFLAAILGGEAGVCSNQKWTCTPDQLRWPPTRTPGT